MQASDCGFVRVPAGLTFPRHRHLGHETSIVLEGTLHDGARVYGPGAVVEWAGESAHEYAAGPGRDLVVMVVHNGIELVDR